MTGAPSDETVAQLVREVARAYALTNAQLVERVRPNVLRVACSTGELAVKLFELRQREDAERETALLVHLLPPEPTYRVQTIVRSASDEAVAQLSAYRVVVTDWVSGRFKPYTAITAPEWHALGKQLGALHVRLATFHAYPMIALSEMWAVRDLGVERDGLRALQTQVPETMREHLATMLATLDAHGGAAAAVPALPEHPIHNDYNQYNYVFDDRLPPVILDWEGAIRALHEYEVVRCMNHLPLVAPAHATAFVTGYREIRALDAEALRWAVDASLADHALKRWPIDRFLAGHADAESAVRRSAEVLRTLVDRLAELRAFYAAHAGRAS